jgi:hypothetical protein
MCKFGRGMSEDRIVAAAVGSLVRPVSDDVLA